jgi:hypothetical protein
VECRVCSEDLRTIATVSLEEVDRPLDRVEILLGRRQRGAAKRVTPASRIRRPISTSMTWCSSEAT